MRDRNRPPEEPERLNVPTARRHLRIGSIVLAAGILLIAIAASVAAVELVDPQRGHSAPSDPPPDLVRRSMPVAPAVAVPTAAPSTVRQAMPVATPPPLLSAPIATPAPTPTPRATSRSTQAAPAAKPPPPPVTNISIPAVGINTSVVEVGYQLEKIGGKQVMQWQVADYAAGHAALSAQPGDGGNIVIAGHDDWKGEVFKNLHDVKLGDQVVLTTAKASYRYDITEIHYRKAIGTSLADRLAAGQFLAAMPQERVTLVTCWPYGVDSYRLIVVAKPVP